MCTAKLFQSNIRSSNSIRCRTSGPEGLVNCRVQGTCCSFRIFSYGPLPDYCMSVPRWWELAQFTSQKCDSVCTDWMKVVDCIVLSGAHLLAVASLGDSPTASTQRGCETLPVVWTVPHGAQCMPTYYTVCVGVHLLHMQSALLTCGTPPSGCCRRLAASPDVSLVCEDIRELVLLALTRPWGLQLD